ncbi:MAG: excinuclease ABC subunit UvrA [Oligoflexia bacterium]|nr:excinuclease ABC subunit UvrA [Oligoflexia bacterium]
MDEIILYGARIHNLKNLNLTIPKNTLTVVTGPSGSGKSSLCFDTIYAEGQRRYMESLSSYARQFLEQFSSTEVDSIRGLSPTLAINQKTNSKNPRSTVGTITEIYDYLRVLYARVGIAHCTKCGNVINRQSAEQITNSILKLPTNTRIELLAPIVKKRKGEHKEELSKFMSLGFSRVRIDGEIKNLSDDLSLNINKNQTHNIEIVVDRIILKDGIKKRLSDSVEQALKIGEGDLLVINSNSNTTNEIFYSEKNSCHHCDISFPELEPRNFSFNSPLGACETCNGLGTTKKFNDNLIIVNKNISINEGAIAPLAKKSSFLYHMVETIAKEEKINLNTPLKDLPKKFLNTLLHGSNKIYNFHFSTENSTFKFKKAFAGIHHWLHRKFYETNSEKIRNDLLEFINTENCTSCNGRRLNPWALSTKILGLSIMDFCELSIENAYQFVKKLEKELKGESAQIAARPLKEVAERLGFLLNVGLNYLTLNRSALTLAGGEGQRIRLATQIGSMLTGVIYVLDEPSIGLHARDNERLIKTLLSLRDLGNTVLVVEHDEETIRQADHIIDMGPGAGNNGGQIVAEGKLEEIMKNKKSLTGRYLSREECIPLIPLNERKKGSEFNSFISLEGATENNLKDLDIKIPLYSFVCVTGVSGSGKSTLIHDVLVPALSSNLVTNKNKIQNKIKNENENEKSSKQKRNYKNLSGHHHISNIIELDQSPIGRTPKSNPATYCGVFDNIRAIFAETSEAKIRGYKPGRFSFNVKGGRCESCEGSGVKKIEMHFMADVYITCQECNGKRYNSETLSILYRGKSIAEILDMSIEDAYNLFQNHKNISRILATLVSVGLGYMKLGQPATTLSGGEAQRLKLSRELGKNSSAHTLYVLDEPTTGLHFSDIKILLKAIHQLVVNGHSVIVIEHNLDVIKTADYIIDLGPEGGDKGGKIMFAGTISELLDRTTQSHTGYYLQKLLNQENSNYRKDN